MSSQRPDGRGHWPRGARRSQAPLPPPLKRKIDRALERGDLTRRSIARALKVSDRSVRRWLSEEDWPSTEHIRGLARLV